MHREIGPDEYDAAVRRRPDCCPLYAMGDRRCGRALLADFPADDAAALRDLAAAPAGHGLLASIPHSLAALARFFASASPPATPGTPAPAASAPASPQLRGEGPAASVAGPRSAAAAAAAASVPSPPAPDPRAAAAGTTTAAAAPASASADGCAAADGCGGAAEGAAAPGGSVAGRRPGPIGRGRGRPGRPPLAARSQPVAAPAAAGGIHDGIGAGDAGEIGGGEIGPTADAAGADCAAGGAGRSAAEEDAADRPDDRALDQSAAPGCEWAAAAAALGIEPGPGAGAEDGPWPLLAEFGPAFGAELQAELLSLPLEAGPQVGLQAELPEAGALMATDLWSDSDLPGLEAEGHTGPTGISHCE
jgi:hypothetical protein